MIFSLFLVGKIQTSNDKLDCAHGFHFNYIKLWLMEKNIFPFYNYMFEKGNISFIYFLKSLCICKLTYNEFFLRE